MKLEIDASKDRNFYREVINVSHQFRALLKNPERKLRDFFMDLTIYILFGVVMLMLIMLMTLKWGFDWLSIVAICLTFTVITFGAVYLISLEKIMKALMNDAVFTVVTLDDEGVEFDQKDSKKIKMSWQKCYFVREFKNSICFVPKDYTSFVMSVHKNYADEICKYMHENKPEIKLIRY